MVVVLLVARAATPARVAEAVFRGNGQAANMGQIVADGLPKEKRAAFWLPLIWCVSADGRLISPAP